MKPSSKAVMIGCISFFVFLYGNLLFGGLVGSLIPSGDDFINSYFYPLYTAVTLLISLIISCTYLILKKINHPAVVKAIKSAVQKLTVALYI